MRGLRLVRGRTGDDDTMRDRLLRLLQDLYGRDFDRGPGVLVSASAQPRLALIRRPVSMGRVLPFPTPGTRRPA